MLWVNGMVGVVCMVVVFVVVVVCGSGGMLSLRCAWCCGCSSVGSCV